MADNPYEAPSANLSGNETYAEHSGGVTQGVVEQLRRTKGWTRFISVLCFIFGSLILLGVLLGGNAFANMSASSRGLARGMSGLVGIIMVIYGIMGVMQFIVGAKLGGFSSSVQRLMYSGQERDLEDALDRQRSFWVFVGVTMLVFLIIGIVSMIGVFNALH